MSNRDLASLRASSASPPASSASHLSSSPPGFIASPSVAAFQQLHEAAVHFRDIRKDTGDTYTRVVIEGAVLSDAEVCATQMLRAAVALREKWVLDRGSGVRTGFHGGKADAAKGGGGGGDQGDGVKETTIAPPWEARDPLLLPPSAHKVSWVDGVASVLGVSCAAGTYGEFAHDMEALSAIVDDPEVRTFTWRRLELATEKFRMYSLLNGDKEALAQKMHPHRDFFNSMKVDTHVHLVSSSTQKHLLSFIKSKLKRHGDDVVLPNRDDPGGDPLTLKQVFESLDMRPEDLSIDTLDVHHSTGQDLFKRFDRFNLKYSPLGQSRLREVFLKTDNLQRGRYLAELTKEVLTDQEFLKYQNAEYRISIYGKSPSEWSTLSDWFWEHEIFSRGTRWLVQIPRLYSSYAERGLVASFGDFLRNIFEPMFEATIDPAAHPRVFALLQQMVGFDSVDDESLTPSKGKLRDCPPPDLWRSSENPPYSYYSYYIASNLAAYNCLRKERGLNTLSYRPHCGEAGPQDHLVASFLLANSINHGIKLKESPSLQYMYYICQIGLAMSPIGNSALFIEYAKNPAMEFFLRGLNVSLSTDDPLQFAMTREPLMEEYSVFAAVNRCSNTDLCELARNSVLQSGFEASVKAHWHGPNWYRAGPAGNDAHRTNVPNMRVMYRNDVLREEIALLWQKSIDIMEPKRIKCLPTWTALE